MTMIDASQFPPRDSGMLRYFGMFLAALLLLGCHHSPQMVARVVPEKPVPQRALDGAVGRVIRINSRLRFVVLDYSLNRIPELGTHLKLYRKNEIVGELALNGPIQNGTAAADIVSGVPQIGDQARLE